MESTLLCVCLLLQAFSAQTDWTGGKGVVWPVTNFGTSFYSSDSITYNVSGQISPMASVVRSKEWIKHVIERSNPRIDGHGALYPVDLDGDGDLDFAGYKSLGCTLTLYRNEMVEHDSVGYRKVVSYPAPPGAKGKYVQTWCGDLDGDDRPDVVVVCSTRMFWYKNLGDFNFTRYDIASAIHTRGAVVGSDINRDGLVDLVVGDRPLEVWYQEPGLTFRRTYVWTGESYKIVVGYINNDEWPDILAEDQVFLNNNGTFPSTPTWNAGLSGPDGIWVRDFNNDGLTDLLICDQWATRPGIYWYENLGDGTSFRQHTVYKCADAQSYGDGACAEDMYSDCRADVVGGYSKVGWFHQVTGDSFELTQIDTITDSHWVRTDNLDYRPGGSDIDIDIYASSRGQFAWWENHQQSLFSAHGWLVSSVLDAGFRATWESFVWDAARSPGTRLDFCVRSGSTPAQCTTGTWSSPISVQVGVQLDSTRLEEYTGDGDRYFQYCVLMAANNTPTPAVCPVVYSIKVVYDRHVDVGVERIQQPVGYINQNEDVTPRADWHNYGLNATDFIAYCFIAKPSGSRVYSQSRVCAGLGPGEQVTLDFPELNVSTTAGAWTVRCSTAAAGDIRPGNDWLDGQFEVGGQVPSVDVGVERIQQPNGYYRVEDNVVPRADWRNHGFCPADFTAYCFIADPSGNRVYSESRAVTGLGPGELATVDFTVLNVGTTTGWWVVRCSTAAAGDVYAGNDQREADFHVSGQPPPRFGWFEVAPVPLSSALRPVSDGAWLAVDAQGLIHCARGNKTTDFYEYDPLVGANGRWRILDSIPALEQGRLKLPHRGCRGVSDGGAYIYMVKGSNTLGFWRYDVPRDSWSPLPDVPLGTNRKKVKGGSDLVYRQDGDTGWVYLLKGCKTEFYRYNVQAERWDVLASVPYGANKAKYDDGSFLVADGARYLYAHQAKYIGTEGHFMFRFDLLGDYWSTRPLRGMPFWGLQGGKLARKKSKGGGCGAWLSGSIYTLKGGNTQQFFRYFPGADSWQELDTIPAMGTTLKKTRVKGGGDMVYSSLRGLFALKGNKSYEFWRYVHPPEPAGGQPQARGAQAGRSAFVGLRFSVAPNPLTSGFATVHYNAPMAGPVLLSVFDIAGRSVLRTAHSVGRSALSVSLDLRKLANGVYLVRLEAQGQHCTRKLVLARR